MMLYEKVMIGRRTTYRAVEGKIVTPPANRDSYSKGELITLGATLGMTVLMQMVQLLPKNNDDAKKIKAVTDAILNLVRGSGHRISDEDAEYWTDTWNMTMANIQAGLAKGRRPKALSDIDWDAKNLVY